MARIHYERLSDEAEDYLDLENSRRRAQTSMTLIFEAGPLATEGGGIDFERIREVVGAKLAELPRLRSKLRRVPGDGHPVWVDDAEFSLDYHLRQSSLARPGNHDQLCATAARVTATRLNRSRPLWECWIFEGLEGGRFALIFKAHQALAGEEAADLLRAILSTTSEQRAVRPVAYRARPAPSPLELFSAEVLRAWSPSRRVLSSTARWIANPRKAVRQARSSADQLLRVLGYALRPSGESPFDGNLGPHRSFELASVPLEAAQRVRSAFGGSVHDAVLSIITGAVHRFLETRRVSAVTVDLHAVTPVLDEDGLAATAWELELPVWEPDLRARHEVIRGQTEALRTESDVSDGGRMSDGDEWNGTRMFAVGAHALEHLERGHLAILQAPGPQQALYLDGARLAEAYGHLPLRDGSGLGITVMSYEGQLFFAFNADAEVVPDLKALSAQVEGAAEDLVAAADAVGPGLRAVSG